MMGDKEIKNLRKENSDLLKKIQSLEKEFESVKTKMASPKVDLANSEAEKSLQFLSKEYDDIKVFAASTTQEMSLLRDDLTRMFAELRNIAERASAIEDTIEAIQQYSYNYNLKITGIPHKPGETDTESSELCVKLFSKIGASGVTLQDIDIAHRVPKRKEQDSEPPAIICKFTRRLAKNQVLRHKKATKNVSASDLGLDSEQAIKKIMVYEHLTPKMQDLHYKCRSFQRENSYKHCWVKNSKIYLRHDDSSKAICVKSYEDLEYI